MSRGFTCPKSEGNYGTWYQWSVNKCLDTGVRITLVWVTGDPHPKNRTKLSNVLLLSLVLFLMHQTLCTNL